MAKTGSVSIQMADILDTFDREFKEHVEKSAQETAKNCAKKLQSTSPKRTGSYAKSWKSKKTSEGYVVYNAKHAPLTHLLENGHIIRNKKGVFGRVPGKKHIAPVEAEGIEEFQNKVSRGVK